MLGVNRWDVLRGVLYKRGWRTYAFGSLVSLGFAINSAAGDDGAPFGFWIAVALGSGGVAYLLYRRTR